MRLPKPGRNDACPCGSGKKFKHCCDLKQRSRGGRWWLLIVGALAVGGLAAAATALREERPAPALRGVWSPEHGHYH